MHIAPRVRWVALVLAGVAILGAAWWIAGPWATHTALRATPAPSPASPQEKPEASMAAAGDGSDMLNMTRAAFVACGAPAAPSELPDGATATREQMVAAHATVKAFDEATTIYTQCLDTTAYQAGVQFKAVATPARHRGVARSSDSASQCRNRSRPGVGQSIQRSVASLQGAAPELADFNSTRQQAMGHGSAQANAARPPSQCRGFRNLSMNWSVLP